MVTGEQFRIASNTLAERDDGFMSWNILDAVLGATPAPTWYPVLRTMEPIGAAR